MSQKKFISYENLVSFYTRLRSTLSDLRTDVDNLNNRTTISYEVKEINATHQLKITKLDNSEITYYIDVQVKDENQIDDLDIDSTTKIHIRSVINNNPSAWFFIFKIPCVDKKSMVTIETNDWGTGIVFDRNGAVCICLRNVHDIPQDAVLTVYNANKDRISEDIVNIT